MKNVLLDTNAYSNLLKGNNHVLEIIDEAETVYISVIVIAELLTGFKGGTGENKNKEILKRFLSKPNIRIIDVSLETAEIFAHIKNLLRSTGNPIPLDDVWIVSHVIETGSVLITFDEHFNKIAGLRVLRLE
ncbi:MAG: type II toxin-antitoxin system VapC family toxin [Bacteroidetes bacterium]|nr:type II toxin-antitoxin system VapC family toxin [Bacteroidota bacterium]